MLKKCKYLLLLIVGLFGFIGFSSAVNIFQNYSDYLIEQEDNIIGKTNYTVSGGVLYCFSFLQGSGASTVRGYFTNTAGSCGFQSASESYYDVNRCYIPCGSSTSQLTINNNGSVPVQDFYLYAFTGGVLPQLGSSQECETCPTTGEILSGACDTNYCVENDLCPISSGSWSELIINDIAHEGRPLINLMIPDYIQWDYTVDENQYDIYVGSGYDQDYIDSILKINSYRPDTKDFTQIFVSGLTLIFPYIFVALLIVFIWKLLKRVFK